MFKGVESQLPYIQHFIKIGILLLLGFPGFQFFDIVQGFHSVREVRESSKLKFKMVVASTFFNKKKHESNTKYS